MIYPAAAMASELIMQPVRTTRSIDGSQAEWRPSTRLAVVELAGRRLAADKEEEDVGRLIIVEVPAVVVAV